MNGGDINTIDSKALTGTAKSYTSPFQQTDLSNTASDSSDVNDTYRSNNAYDNTDRSMNIPDNGYIIRNAKKALFEKEDYWRTNI